MTRGLAIALVLASTAAQAASPEFCEVFAREFVRVKFLHNREIAKAEWATPDQRARAAEYSDPNKQAFYLARNYTTCINSDRELRLPRHLPEASDQAWLQWLLSEPVQTGSNYSDPIPETTEEPVEVVDADAKAERDRACRRRFGSYDPDTGTVLKHGDKKRTPCPVP